MRPDSRHCEKFIIRATGSLVSGAHRYAVQLYAQTIKILHQFAREVLLFVVWLNQ